MSKLLVGLLALLLFGPTAGLVGISALMTPALLACTMGPSNIAVGAVPDQLAVTTSSGETITLNQTQLTRAATIIETGASIDEVGRDGILIALMAALTESSLRMLSNVTAAPESAGFPNDGDGSDHDSLGLFQMRPSTGWGTVAELMDPGFQARAFYGGPTGPHHGSPQGLLDIPGWQQLSKGEAAQAVEGSAFPDRYATFEPVATAILDALAQPRSPSASPSPGSSVATMPAASKVVFPLPEGTWTITDVFGPRVHPITGEVRTHTGLDLGAAAGTPILAVADGVVTIAASGVDGYGGLIVIEHRFGDQVIATAYGHMWETGIHVSPGDHVTAGQHIGDVGSAGASTGPHLYFEVRPGGTSAPAIDPAPWLTAHGAQGLPASAIAPPAPSAGCAAVGTRGT